jgi:hypothetical protein
MLLLLNAGAPDDLVLQAAPVRAAARVPSPGVLSGVTSAATNYRTQTLTRTATGGTITLTYSGQTTGTIASTAAGLTASAVEAALVALSNIAPADVEVTGSAGGPLTVTIAGAYAGTLAAPLLVNNTSATGGTVTAAPEVPEVEFRVHAPDGTFQGLIDEWLDGTGWEVVNNDAGGGTLTAAFDNTTTDVVDLGDIIRCWYRGVPVFQWVVDEFDHDTIPPDGGEGFKKWTGSGLIATLNHARVAPSRGFAAKPVEDTRPFGWQSATYDGDFFWANAVELALQGQTDADQSWLPQHRVPGGWPDPAAYWIWGTPGTTGVAPEGPCYFHYRWDAPSELSVRLFAAIDNHGFVYLDGQKVLDVDTFVEPSTVDVVISSGSHSFAVYAYNDADNEVPGDNPGGVLVAAYVVNSDGTLGDLLFHTDSDWKVVSYPSNPPGTQWGKVLSDLLDEARDRGLLPDWTWDFDWPTDSNGAAFPIVWDPSAPVGTDYWQVIQQAVAAGDIDVRLSPAGFLLHVYAGGTAGISTGVSLTVASDVNDPTSGNLLLLRHRGQAVVANVALIRWAQGWHYLDMSGADEPIEITLELGSVDDLTEAIRIATAVLESMGERIEAQVEVEVRDGEVPFHDYLPGDLVTVPGVDLAGGEQRVVSIAVAVQGDEIRVTPKLRDRLLEDDERIANWLKLWNDGAARGDNRALNPANPPDPMRSGERILTETWQLPAGLSGAYTWGPWGPLAPANLRVMRFRAVEPTTAAMVFTVAVDGVTVDTATLPLGAQFIELFLGVPQTPDQVLTLSVDDADGTEVTGILSYTIG